MATWHGPTRELPVLYRRGTAVSMSTPRPVSTVAMATRHPVATAPVRPLVADVRYVDTPDTVAKRWDPSTWPLGLVILGHFVLMAIVLSPIAILAN